MFSMRISLDIPDELHRRVAAEAKLHACKIEDLVEEALRRLPDAAERAKSRPSLLDLMRDCCGIAEDTPSDYATNPKYLDGFGR
jgi:hypothetical protein